MLYVSDTSIKQEEKKVMFQDTCDQMLLILKEIQISNEGDEIRGHFEVLMLNVVLCYESF